MNVIGTQNMADVVSCLSTQTKILFVSTDKACAPVNVYGMCKAVSERLITSLVAPTTHVTALCTRYGNVLDSRGSIIPLFRHQAAHSDSFTVTDPDMTRFVMTLDDSVDLIIDTLERGQNGETWVPKIPAMRIGDLVEIFSERYNKPITTVGLRPGEKKHEDLVNESESVRTKETSSHYVIAASTVDPVRTDRFSYSSSQCVLSKDELRAHLTALRMFSIPIDKFKGLSIDEIRH